MKNKEGKDIISTHSFMMPLRWDYLPEGYGPEKDMLQFSFDERTNMHVMNEFLLKSGWDRKFYRINNEAENYNELTYFHGFVAKTIFDLQQPGEATIEKVDDNKVMTYYEIEPLEDEDAYYKIETSIGTYTLSLKGISLHCYNTGIAILTYNLENYEYQNPEDILKINEFGRRVYTPFLTNDLIAGNKAKEHAAHPKSVEIYCSKINNGASVLENFTHYDDLSAMETHQVINNKYEYGLIVKLPSHIIVLFGNAFVFNAKHQAATKIRFNVLADERMFFQCWYGDDEISKSVKAETYPKYVYAFIHGDKDPKWPSIANEKMMKEELEKITYNRWLGCGTVFGFSKDSFVCITEAENKLQVPLNIHMKTMYYQMAVLSLAQRASVLRFSAEVSTLADLGKADKTKAVDLIEKLHLNYIEFINKIYFREVTSQIQGIEVYQKFQTVMNMSNDVKDLDGEIKELFNYASMIRQDQQQKESQRLTNIATWFLPAGVVVGIMGMNAFDSKTMNFGEAMIKNAWLWIGFAIVFSLLVAEALFNFKHVKRFIKFITQKK
jgi:CorA-like Mg2+ transporter protein